MTEQGGGAAGPSQRAGRPGFRWLLAITIIVVLAGAITAVAVRTHSAGDGGSSATTSTRASSDASAKPAPGSPSNLPVTSVSAEPSAATTPVPPPVWGVAIDPTAPVADAIAAASALLGHPVTIVHRFISMAWNPETQLTVVRELAAQSSAEQTVLITWEPGAEDGGAGGVSMSAIAAGELDAQLTTFLTELAAIRGPVALRVGHEMNGTWYPWSGDATAFLAGWRHIRDLVHSIAPTVRMVWSVNNVDRPSSNTMEQYWPGADQVDLIGIDGYNCLRGWESPDKVFSEVYRRVTALGPGLPIWITETSSCEATSAVVGSAGHSKAEWIAELFAMPELAGIQAIVWFDRNKEFDWRLDSSPEAAAALSAALSCAACR